MSSPINYPLGGLYGEMQRLGVTITPGSPPSWQMDGDFTVVGTFTRDGEDTFGSTVTFEDVATFEAMPVVQGSDVELIQQGALTAATSAFGWANPWSVPILITAFYLEVTTVATGACTLDAGLAATVSTTDDTLLDGQDVNAATGIFVSNATPIRLDEAGGTADCVTVRVASGTVTGLAGRVYIKYVPIQ